VDRFGGSSGSAELVIFGLATGLVDPTSVGVFFPRR
jgi:hypothetical protein